MFRHSFPTSGRAIARGLPARALLCAAFCLLLHAWPDAARARDIGTREAAALLQSPPQGLLILDVRTPDEFRRGHLPGARNMDFFGGRFDLEAAALPREQPVLLYCRTGRRSAEAAETLEKAGVKTILHMNQGIEAWQADGLPLEK
ncbi:rhodanese-like domain-containing protein [Desulfovibrio sp. SGI.169]|uniref:rhodanese-like domain-containing protein n=1 Tax=Desulfovibrio sp. SGI.169 TaxID=3420561 RepID=UPI003D038322